MSIDNRKALPKGYELTIAEEGSENLYSVVITDEIGRGGSCIVYKGEREESINGNKKSHSVIVKEFYPTGLNIIREDNNKSLNLSNLDVQEIELYKSLLNHFGEGQSKNVDFYEYYVDQLLPRIFIYGKANDTVYAVSNPGIGRTLSEIPFDDSLSLNRVASIMESICDAIGKIHTKEMLYLDCKPDNFFYYFENKDLQSEVFLFDFDTIVSIRDIQRGNYSFCSASKGWIPPEQYLMPNTGGYRDPQNIGYHTDIFSVGAVFFWLLTQRKPTEKDLRAIQENTFDLGIESSICNGADIETIKCVQDILHKLLQFDISIRQELFHNYLSIRRIARKKFECLYGLTVGNNTHFEPIHSRLTIIDSKLEDLIENMRKLESLLCENNGNNEIESETITPKSEGWGAWERRLYTNDSKPSYAVFNSIIDNAGVGDERNFVRVGEIGTNEKYTDLLEIESGKEYEVYIYYRNDANPDSNNSGYGIATDTRVSSGYPVMLKAGEKGMISGIISWSYVKPENDSPSDGVVWNEAYFIAKEDVSIKFRAGSAVIHNGGASNGSILPTSLFSLAGTPIGYNKLAGLIPGGAEYSGYITYTLVVEKLAE